MSDYPTNRELQWFVSDAKEVSAEGKDSPNSKKNARRERQQNGEY